MSRSKSISILDMLQVVREILFPMRVIPLEVHILINWASTSPS